MKKIFTIDDFIVAGIAANEMQTYKSSVGNKKYEDFIFKELNNILSFFDSVYLVGANSVRDYIEEQTATMSAAEDQKQQS